MRAAHINRDRAHTHRLFVVTPEAAYIDRLLAAGRGDLEDWPLALEPEQLGLTRAGGKVGFGGPIERLSPHRIRSDVSRAARQWLAELQVFPVIDSTNSALLERSGGFAGCVYLAECQTGGRGRRGRAWFSPLARNLALSAGFSLKGVSVPLDGLSLTVGLAVVDALDRVGLRGLGLKWPNDVYVDGRKLCGILVEVVPGASGSVAAPAGLVVGIGINYELPESVEAAIDQHTTDVLRHGRVGRNALAAGSSVRCGTSCGSFNVWALAPCARPGWPTMCCRVIRWKSRDPMVSWPRALPAELMSQVIC